MLVQCHGVDWYHVGVGGRCVADDGCVLVFLSVLVLLFVDLGAIVGVGLGSVVGVRLRVGFGIGVGGRVLVLTVLLVFAPILNQMLSSAGVGGVVVWCCVHIYFSHSFLAPQVMFVL